MKLYLQTETQAALDKVPVGTVSYQATNLGVQQGEPLLVAMDGMLRYAKAYAKHRESLLSDDGILGPLWLDVVNGLRGLLNGDGAVAMERDITTDSKDNGSIEEIFWAAIKAAGFEESDL